MYMKAESLLLGNVPSMLHVRACTHKPWDEPTQENLERT